MTRHHQSLARGALFMVGSALLFALMGVGVKMAAERLPNTIVVFFRSAVGLLVLLPWVARLGVAGLSTVHFKEHVIRGLAGLGAMYCFFYAIAHMRLADAVLLNYSLPMFMPIVENVWLHEPFPPRLWWPISLGFLGVLFILKPGLGVFEPVALVGLMAALFAAVAQVGIRRLTRTEPITRIVFYFGVISTVLSALPLPVLWRTPRGSLWLVLLATGLFATLAQLFLTRAYAHAPAARVGPFIYSAVVFAGLLDWMVWGRLPDRLSLCGTALVVAAGILALRLRDAPTVTAEPA
jgi:drug/metabolite transporter (DMT)-like permease